MSKILCLKWTLISISLFTLLVGCAPLVPDNYLSPRTIVAREKINGKWRNTRIIPVSAQMLDTPDGQKLLKPAMSPQPYRIGAFDVLNIIVWGHPEVSSLTISTLPVPGSPGSIPAAASTGGNNPPAIVQPNGTIFYPYVGHLKVTGLTLDELQEKLTERLSKYIRNPQVSAEVIRFRNRSVYVLGAVNNPGMQALTDKPLSLMEGISAAGGINPQSADPTHIYVIRGTYQDHVVFLLNSRSSQALLIAEKFPLQENDIVFVSAAVLNSWNNLINEVLPTFANYYAIKGLTQELSK